MTTAPFTDALVEAEHWQAEPVCEIEFIKWDGIIECRNPASWWGIAKCCGERGLWCNSCKDRAECKGDFRYWLNMCTCGGRDNVEWTKL